MFPLVMPSTLSMMEYEALHDLLAWLDAGGRRKEAAIWLLASVTTTLLKVTTNMADTDAMFDMRDTPGERFWSASADFAPLPNLPPSRPPNTEPPLWYTANPFQPLALDLADDLVDDLADDLNGDLICAVTVELDTGSPLGGGAAAQRKTTRRRKRGPRPPAPKAPIRATVPTTNTGEADRKPAPTVVYLLPARRAGRKRVKGVRKRSGTGKRRWLLAAHLTFVWVLTAIGIGEWDATPTTSETHGLNIDNGADGVAIDEFVSIKPVNAWLALKAPLMELLVWDLRWRKQSDYALG
jgi:hypothetical protein